MDDVNRVILTGRLSRNPVTSGNESGMVTVEFSLAVNRKYFNLQGEEKKDTTWVKCVCWIDSLSRVITERISRGNKVSIIGAITKNSECAIHEIHILEKGI